MVKEEWYSPAEVKFTSPQVFWMILYVLPLEPQVIWNQGHGCFETEDLLWPPRGDETGYIDNTEGHAVFAFGHAGFEVAAGVRGILKSRLTKTGKDGERLTKRIQSGYGDRLTSDEKMAMSYCCGPARQQTYAEFRSDCNTGKNGKKFGLGKFCLVKR